MNPKIIIAALDAGLINYIDNETPRHYYISGNAEIEEVEKFAELIIAETCKILAENGELRAATLVGKHFPLWK